ncbi:MAG TPA: ATP synthase F1 subunit epsilon [Clostridiales bacterium]|nr:ATP synthase F1 subunit epsilon [Clostridiales bacterium]
MGDVMGGKKVHLQIFTPRGLKIEEKADMLVMRCIDGDMGVLPGHAAVSAALGDGILRIINNSRTEQKIAVFGGVAVVKDDLVRIMTTIAQRPGEIDLPRAEADRRQAELLLQERSEDVKIQSYQVMLRRALVRIEVSVYPQEDED